MISPDALHATNPSYMEPVTPSPDEMPETQEPDELPTLQVFTEKVIGFAASGQVERSMSILDIDVDSLPCNIDEVRTPDHGTPPLHVVSGLHKGDCLARLFYVDAGIETETRDYLVTKSEKDGSGVLVSTDLIEHELRSGEPTWVNSRAQATLIGLRSKGVLTAGLHLTDILDNIQ